MNIQDTAIYTLGGVAATALGALTFLSSPFFGPFFGGVVAATAGYVYSSRAWRRTIKRENDLRNNDLIYRPLYKEIGEISDRCKSFDYMSAYQTLNYPAWNQIRSEPYYRVIGEPLRGELDAFYKIVDAFNANQEKVSSIGTLIVQEFSKKFELPAYSVEYISKDPSGREMQTTYFNQTILSGVHPSEVLKRGFPNRNDLKFYPRFRITYASGVGVNIDYTEPKQIAAFDEFYFQLSDRIRNSPEMKGLKTALEEIIRKAPGVRDSLFQVYRKTSA